MSRQTLLSIFAFSLAWLALAVSIASCIRRL